jgi:hypothetical protein
MLSCLLLVAQLQAADVPWYQTPVVLDLHPVHYSYWARYHQLYVDRTTGWSGSPVFREPMAASAVYYSLWDATGQRPILEDETAERWRDMAISSASIAAEALMWETVDRSPELGGAVRFMRTFVSPNLQLQRRQDGWKARANDPDIRLRPEIERRELQEGMLEGPGRRPGGGPPGQAPGRPPATITLGSGLDIQDVDGLTDRERTVDAAMWLRLQRIGPDQLTLRGLALSQTWELSGRQHIVRGVSAAAALSSRSNSYLPKDWGTGLSWSLPGNRWWTLVLRYRRDIVFEPSEDPEWNLRVMVRWLPPARPPVIPDVWPLGQRIDAPGPCYPSEPRGQPNEAEPALEPPIARTLPGDEPQPDDRAPSGSSAAPR